MKKLKHSTQFLFGSSIKAKQQRRELTQVRYLLSLSAKKLKGQKKALRLYSERWKELRDYLKKQHMPDIEKDTNLFEYLMRYIGDLK